MNTHLNFLREPRKKKPALPFRHYQTQTNQMAALAEQLIAAFSQSGAEKMCLTVNPSGCNYQPPMQLTVQFLNADGSACDSKKRGREPSSEEEVQPGKRRKGGKGTRVKKFILDPVATLAKYRERISALPASEFAEFAGAIITDYKLHDCAPTDAVPRTHAFLLADIARSKGAVPAGIVSANKKEKKYLEALPNGLLRPDEGGEAKMVYIGDKNQFTGMTEASKWAVTKDDKVMVPNTPENAAAFQAPVASEGSVISTTVSSSTATATA